MSRFFDLEGIENFRDFGDYPVGDKRIVKGRLYRSANHGRATAADLERLRALNLHTIVDLRRSDERAREPSRRWEDFACQVIDNDIGDDAADAWHEFVRTCDLSPQTFSAHMAEWYETAAFEPRHIDLFSRSLKTLSLHEGPMLIHCAAGKDRTGILCGLIHHLAGAHRDDIIEDYLHTNRVTKKDAHVARMGDYVEQLNGRRPSDEAIRTAMGVEARFLESAFASMAARHGSIDGYIEEALGLDAAARAAVAEGLTT